MLTRCKTKILLRITANDTLLSTYLSKSEQFQLIYGLTVISILRFTL